MDVDGENAVLSLVVELQWYLTLQTLGKDKIIHIFPFAPDLSVRSAQLVMTEDYKSFCHTSVFDQ